MNLNDQHILDIPTYIFGAGSTLCDPVMSAVVPQTEIASLWYVAAVFVVAAIYLMWLNYWGTKGQMHWTLFRFLGYHRGDYSAKTALLGPSFSRYSTIGTVIGFVSIWILFVALLGGYSSISPKDSLAILLAIVAIYIYQQLIVNLIGVVTNGLDFTKVIIKLKAIFYTIMAIALIPTGLCYLMATGIAQQIFMYIIAIQVLAVGVMFLYETFLLFLTKKVSLLHTILYLCAVEIFPLTFIWGFFSR